LGHPHTCGVVEGKGYFGTLLILLSLDFSQDSRNGTVWLEHSDNKTALEIADLIQIFFRSAFL